MKLKQDENKEGVTSVNYWKSVIKRNLESSEKINYMQASSSTINDWLFISEKSPDTVKLHAQIVEIVPQELFIQWI